MKKRVLGLLLVSCLLLIAGCGEKENKESKKEDKKENTIKVLSCSSEADKVEIDKDDDGNSIMGIQGQIAEYKYDTKKNELTEMTASMYVKFENASEDYISKQADEAKATCDLFKDDDTIKNCEIKKDNTKVEIYMEANIDKVFEENEEITKSSSFEEIEKYAKKDAEDEGLTCTVK